jgi:hypothetical protein
MAKSIAAEPFDFASGDPNRLLVECEPEDLFRAVKALPTWTSRALAVAQSALAYWAGNAIASPGNREGIGELRSLIRRLQAVQPLARQDSSLDVAARYHHWSGMVAVLEARAHQMDYHDDAEIESRAHMKELRNLLQAANASEGLSTQALQERLGLSAARLSQVLALAEAAGLIQRRKVRREKLVSVAGRWLQTGNTDKTQPEEAKPGKVVQFSPKRGAIWLAA